MKDKLEKSDGRRTDTREKLLDVAAKAFATSGFDGVTLDEIARKLKLTSAAVFKHFESKSALYDAVLETAIDSFAQPASTLFARSLPPRETIVALCSLYWDYCAAHPSAAALALWECRLADSDRVRRLQINNVYLLELLRATLRKGQEENEIRDLDPDFFIFCLISTSAAFFAAPGLRLHLWNNLSSAQALATAKLSFMATFERLLTPDHK